VLAPTFHAGPCAVLLLLHFEHRAAAEVVGSRIVVQHEGGVIGSAGVMSAVEMVIRSQREQDPIGEAVGPMEADQFVLFEIEIANSGCLSVLRIWNLIVIFANRSDPTELILGARIVKERNKSTDAAVLIVDNL